MALTDVVFNGKSVAKASLGGKVFWERFPYVYCDYIQFDGVAYLDTGIMHTGGHIVTLGVRDLVHSGTNWLFGCGYSSGARRYACASRASDMYPCSSNKSLALTAGLGDISNQLLIFDSYGVEYSNTNGERVKWLSGTTSTNWPNGYSYYLGTIYNGSVNGAKSVWKCTRFKVVDLDGTTVIADFLPCKVKATGVYGFYDIVAETFHPADGGTLTGGDFA